MNHDVVYGGLGGDWIHGGEGNDLLSGAEALPQFYDADAFVAGIRPRLATEIVPGATDPSGYDPATGRFAGIDYGALRPTPAGHLLGFDRTADDGDDVIFGDLGNDWLVGGNGADHLWGGIGNDIMDAVDRGTVADADIVFGGTGLDLLFGGDHDVLIDWTAANNRWVAGSSPIVIDTYDPELAAFLAELAEADGADPGGRGLNPPGAPDDEAGILPVPADPGTPGTDTYYECQVERCPQPCVFVCVPPAGPGADPGRGAGSGSATRPGGATILAVTGGEPGPLRPLALLALIVLALGLLLVVARSRRRTVHHSRRARARARA